MFDWIRKRVGGKRNKNYSNMVKQAGKQSKAYTSNNIKSGSGKSSGKPKSSSRGSSSNSRSSGRGNSGSRSRSAGGSSSVRGGASGIGAKTVNKGSSAKGRSSSSSVRGGISGIGSSSVKGNSSSKKTASVSKTSNGSISSKLTDINPFGTSGKGRTNNPYGGSLIKVTSYNKDGTKKSETTIRTGSEKNSSSKGSTKGKVTSKGGITSKTVEEAVKNIRPQGSYDTSKYKDNIEKNRPVTGNVNKNIKREGSISSKTVREVMKDFEKYGNHKAGYNTGVYKARAEKNKALTNNGDKNIKRKGTLSSKTLKAIGNDTKAYGKFDKSYTTDKASVMRKNVNEQKGTLSLKAIKEISGNAKTYGKIGGEVTKPKVSNSARSRGINEAMNNAKPYGQLDKASTTGNIKEERYISNEEKEKRLKNTELKYDKSRVNKILGRNKGSNLAFENAEAIAKNPAFKDVGVKAVKDMSVEERKRAYAMYYDKLKGSKNPNDVIKAKEDRDKYISMLGNRHAERESKVIKKNYDSNDFKTLLNLALTSFLDSNAQNVRGLMQTGKMMGSDPNVFDKNPLTMTLKDLEKNGTNAQKTSVNAGNTAGDLAYALLMNSLGPLGSLAALGSEYGKNYENNINYNGKNRNSSSSEARKNAVRSNASDILSEGAAVGIPYDNKYTEILKYLLSNLMKDRMSKDKNKK